MSHRPLILNSPAQISASWVLCSWLVGGRGRGRGSGRGAGAGEVAVEVAGEVEVAGADEGEGEVAGAGEVEGAGAGEGEGEVADTRTHSTPFLRSISSANMAKVEIQWRERRVCLLVKLPPVCQLARDPCKSALLIFPEADWCLPTCRLTDGFRLDFSC